MTSVVVTGRRMKSSEMFMTRFPSDGLISTFAPGASRSCPSVTTRSPASRPLATTASAPWVPATSTGRDSTVRSS